MKQYILGIALLIATVNADASSVCMSCRLKDKGAGFLVTYSFCDKVNNELEECLENVWNYIN